MIKTLSRHQTLVSLSSMEADLFALQSVAQELSSMGKIVARVLGSFKEIDAEQTIPGVLYSDSESALKLLRNLDLPRKSRHLEIRISWIKERVERKRLVLQLIRPSHPVLAKRCFRFASFEYRIRDHGLSTCRTYGSCARVCVC